MAKSSSPAPLVFSQGIIGVTIHPAGRRIYPLWLPANPWLSASTPSALRLRGLKHKHIAAELLEKLVKDEHSE